MSCVEIANALAGIAIGFIVIIAIIKVVVWLDK